MTCVMLESISPRPRGTDPDQVVSAVNRASGFLRRRLGERVRLKYLPRLVFAYDSTLDQADRLARLMNEANSRSSDGLKPTAKSGPRQDREPN